MPTTIAAGFDRLRQNLEITDRQAATVSTRQTSVREAVEADLTVLGSFLVGSYGRNTMISPLSKADIDIFVVLSADYFKQYRPAALSSISTFLNPSEKAQAFSQAGNRYNALRARARFLREVTGRTAATPEEQAAELKEILAEKDKLSQESPIIPRPAFERARKGIEAGEAAYAADAKPRQH